MKQFESHQDFLIQELKNKNFREKFVDGVFKTYYEDNDEKSLLLSLRYVAEAEGGIGEVAKNSSFLNRESLYKILTAKRLPKFPNFLHLLEALKIKRLIIG
jgi:DNA-binding phage protein